MKCLKFWFKIILTQNLRSVSKTVFSNHEIKVSDQIEHTCKSNVFFFYKSNWHLENWNRWNLVQIGEIFTTDWVPTFKTVHCYFTFLPTLWNFRKFQSLSLEWTWPGLNQFQPGQHRSLHKITLFTQVKHHHQQIIKSTRYEYCTYSNIWGMGAVFE